MADSELKHLFAYTEFSEGRTTQWATHIKKHQQHLTNCRVVSFTRFKDLSSQWNHEYVQFVIEDISTGERTSVHAQRVLDEWGDFVTPGPGPGPGQVGVTAIEDSSDAISSSETSGSVPLPLPLTSLVFGGPSGTDNQQRPTVLLVAEILSSTTVICGNYSVFDTNSFWFAVTSYDALKRRAGSWAREEAWRWFDTGGAAYESFRDISGLDWTTVFRWGYVGETSEFRELMKHPRRLVSAPLVVDAEEDDGYGVFVDKHEKAIGIALLLERDGDMDEYVEVLRDRCINLDRAEIQKRLQIIIRQEDVKVDVYNQLITNTILQTSFVEQVLSNHDAASQLESYYYQRSQTLSSPEMDWDREPSDPSPSPSPSFSAAATMTTTGLGTATVRALHATVSTILDRVFQRQSSFE